MPRLQNILYKAMGWLNSKECAIKSENWQSLLQEIEAGFSALDEFLSRPAVYVEKNSELN